MPINRNAELCAPPNSHGLQALFPWRFYSPEAVDELHPFGVMSHPPVDIRPWRECPFTRGKRYRVRQRIAALRDSFTVGEVLTFDSDAWSRYDGITGYFFRQAGRDTLRVWDIDDDADIQIWRELFEELPETVTLDDI